MAGPQQDIFDVPRIRRIMQLMKEFDLNEMNLQQGDAQIQLKRGGVSVVPSVPVQTLSTPSENVSSEGSASGHGVPHKVEEESYIAYVECPMVGTFYAKPDPNSPPFVSVGDVIGPDKPVCVIEAMKVYNQIPAKVSGKVVAVLVQNGEPVEFGQKLFKVDTRG